MIIIFVMIACERNSIPCSTLSPQSALIPVAVDWSESGLYVAESRNDEDEVHRLSLRFFPDDGGEPFERYLESNLNSANI
ncbi:MAG: hypothetical protein SNJ35_05910 [Rikenellaceae bacterium]